MRCSARFSRWMAGEPGSSRSAAAPVELGLEPRHEPLPIAGVRGGPPCRGHLSRPELVQDLLEDRRLLAHRRVAHAGQGQAGGAGPVVVASETVTVDGSLQEVAGRGRSSSATLGCRRAGGEPGWRGGAREGDDRPARRIPRGGKGSRERRGALGRARLKGRVPPGGDEVSVRAWQCRRGRLAGGAPNGGGEAGRPCGAFRRNRLTGRARRRRRPRHECQRNRAGQTRERSMRRTAGALARHDAGSLPLTA